MNRIDGLLNSNQNIREIIIYSIDTDRKLILEGKNSTFNFSSSKNEEKIMFKKIYFPFLMEVKTWPICTIVGQSIGAAIVFTIALFTFVMLFLFELQELRKKEFGSCQQQ
jgi:hypothetical protein